jgi:nucleoside 2-deoxyribosyltransferase
MTAYISISYCKRNFLDSELKAIIAVLINFKINPSVFVDKYRFELKEEKQMMQQAMKDIENCNIFIAETSEKAIGIGVEAGYAKGKNKPVIYLRNSKAEHSTTVAGISDFSIVYDNADDLQQKFATVINNLIKENDEQGWHRYPNN